MSVRIIPPDNKQDNPVTRTKVAVIKKHKITKIHKLTSSAGTTARPVPVIKAKTTP
jgi:hypothetical protein